MKCGLTGGWRRIHKNCMSFTCGSSFLSSNKVSINLVIALHGEQLKDQLENLLGLHDMHHP
jgi:hypothetical protein